MAPPARRRRGVSPDGRPRYSSRVGSRWRADYLKNLGDTVIWSVSLAARSTRQVVSLDGRIGNLGMYGLSVGREHLYFTWEETLGDIWVMDVVTDEDS